jgi:hypothetical protein
MDFLKFQPVTERQLTMDLLLLLNRLESPTFAKAKSGHFEVRRDLNRVLLHLTPKGLDNILQRFLNMARVLTELE